MTEVYRLCKRMIFLADAYFLLGGYLFHLFYEVVNSNDKTILGIKQDEILRGFYSLGSLPQNCNHI